MGKRILEKSLQIQLNKLDGMPNNQQEDRRPSTGVGVMIHGIEKARRHEKELLELKERLHNLDGATQVIKIDPLKITHSPFANRLKFEYETKDFLALKEEILNAGGNIQPIKVRPKGVGYEIVYGHRRHRACLELGIPVLSMVEEMLDEALWVEMDRENRNRKSLSQYEQGLSYKKAIESGLFSSQRHLSKKIGVPQPHIAWCIRIADLPEEIISAFSSPTEIIRRMIVPLENALILDRKKVINTAIDLAGSKKSTQEVFAKLTSLAVKPMEEKKIYKDSNLFAIIQNTGKNKVMINSSFICFDDIVSWVTSQATTITKP